MALLIEYISPSLNQVPTQEMLELFQGIKSGSVKRYKGICRTVQEYFNTKYNTCLSYHWTQKWLMPYFQAWDKFSGNLDYPVAGHGRQAANVAYVRAIGDSAWEGTYGKKRLALVDHIIAALEAKIDAHKVSKKKFRAPDISYTFGNGPTYKGRADAVLKRLESIQVRQKAPLRNASKQGICNMYTCLPGGPDPDVLRALFQTWPKHSGSNMYPVPSTTGISPERAYDSEPRWTGKSGKLRRELLQHCINECKRRINEARVKQGFPTIT